MERGPTLPGVGATDDTDRIVLHVDLDCFYAACERLREPALEGEPVVVGMGYEPGEPDGAVATASYEAREYGVESAQAISTALERLPRAGTVDGGDGSGSAGTAEDGADEPTGYYRPVDMEYYQSVAADVKAILHDAADVVREVSIDEAYLDVTERTDWSVAEGYARHVKQRVEREVGLVASVGVAPTMHAAKVASDHDKPDGLVVVEPGEVQSFLAPLPVEELHGIGPVTAGELREQGVERVADLAEADRDWLAERWGDRGVELHQRARGVDPRTVEPRGRPKSLSRESAFAEPEPDADAVRERLRALAEAVADRARSKDALYRTIGIKVVLPPYDVNTRARSLPGPVDDPALVERVALDLHEEFADERPRKVGVRVSNLEFEAADQSTLGGWEGDDPSDDGTGPSVEGAGSPDATAPSDGRDGRDAGPTERATAADQADPTDEPARTDPAATAERSVETTEATGDGVADAADAGGEGGLADGQVSLGAVTAAADSRGTDRSDADASGTTATASSDEADAEPGDDESGASPLPPRAASTPPGQATLGEFLVE